MASLSTDNGGGRRILFLSPLDGKRKAIRLGRLAKKAAETVCIRVEYLVNAQAMGTPIDPETAAWVANLGTDLRNKLARAGLVEADQRTRMNLGEFLDHYFSIRSDVKPATLTVWGQTRRLLEDFFGKSKPVCSISPGDAEEWRLYCKEQGLAETTLRKRCQFAKQFFRFAVKKSFTERNPFEELKSANLANPGRYYFLSRDHAQRVNDACPNASWRLLFALARFGGLRTPSESVLLKWVDVNWEQNRLTINSPKTEHHAGGESRVIPLFPELKPFLDEQFELAEPGAVYVLPDNLRTHANLGTYLRKIVLRAGLQPWPKLWQNLRSTRQTELSEQFPAHVVCAWLGNSEAVAKLHYLQVTDDHFQKAVFSVAQNPAQYSTAYTRIDSQSPKMQKPQTPVMQGLADSCELVQCTKVEDRGLEPLTFWLPARRSPN